MVSVYAEHSALRSDPRIITKCLQMEKITRFSGHARALIQKSYVLIAAMLLVSTLQLQGQFGCELAVQDFTIIIDEEDECIDILDINPDGICCPDSVSSGGCIELNLTIPAGNCIALYRDGEVAEGRFFVDECANSQNNGLNLEPSSPTATTMNLVYCTTEDGTFDFQVCAKPCCILDVECPDTEGGIMSCTEQVPAPAATIAEFLTLPGAAINEFCDPVSISSEVVVTTTSGCPGDTIFAAHVYTIRDAYDSTFCTRFYRVVDDVPPSFTPPADTTISCEEGIDPAITGEPTNVMDNCLTRTVESDFVDLTPTIACDNSFTFERIWSFVDNCGNDTTYTQTISVVDTTGPTYDTPSDTLVVCQGDTTVATLGMPENIMDNCAADFAIRHRDELVTSPCPMSYTVWRIWEVEDLCDNITIDTQTIEVADTVPPTYILPPNALIDCADDTSTTALGVPTMLDDNCHMVSFTYRDEIFPSRICGSTYDFMRIWTIVDECGNTVVDTQVISVRDNTPPELEAPADTIVSCEANLSPMNLGRLVSISDDCSATITTMRDDTVSVDCQGSYVLRRVWIGEDECGNVDSAEQTITVIDTVAPVVQWPRDLLIPCLGDTSPASTGVPMAMDNCSDTTIITYTDAVITTACAAEFTVERTWRVMDDCENDVTHTQIIEVECIEKLGIAKTVYDIDPGSSGVRGNFNTTYEITFINDGNTKLTDIQVKDDLAIGFGSTLVGMVPGGEPQVVSSTADTTPTVNPNFDGVGDINIFAGDDGCMQPGQTVTLRFTFEVNPRTLGAPEEALNTAVACAMGPCLLPVADSSDTGKDPLGTNPGEYGDTGGSDDPTVLRLECVGTGAPAMACNRHTNISLDENCSLDFPAHVILEGEEYRCDPFYELMITDHHGRIVPTPIPGELKGETLYVKVIDAVFGNSCWGTILVEDKFKPTIVCENDTVYCNVLDSVPPPLYFDNCDPDPVLSLVRTTKEDLTCDTFYTKRVTKYWQAEDNCGNKSDICKQVIMLRRVFLDSIEYPKDYTLENNCALACNGVFPLDTNGHPDPSFTGAPSIDGVSLYPYFQHCNISTDYTDRVIKDGPCVKKIMRLWRVVEWHCTNSAIREVPQLIHIIDDQPPVITCPTIDWVTTNGGYTCEADVHLPEAIVYDSCSFDSVTVDIVYPGGILKNQNGGKITLPFGTHTITYVAYDQCYNSSSCTVDVLVEDLTPPVTICDGFTTVGLNEHGEAHLYAETLDDGTYDDCYLDSFAVRRMDMGARCGYPDTLFKPYIRFCCEDVDSNVMVVFRAWDKAGNYNDCMVEVEVQDKVPPIVYCPPNITISCEYHFDMDSLGKYFGTVVQDKDDRQPIVINDPNVRADGPLLDGHVLENCPVDIEEMVVDSISQCRTGTILRGFTATDRQGLQTQCYQRITIIDFDPFDTTDIIWPLNYETDVCGAAFHPDSLPEEFGRPRINDDICSLVGMEFEDHVFSFVPDPLVCYKVLRKWKIIDWCNFRMEGNTQIYKRYEYEQIIKVNNSVGPELTGDCSALSICTYDPDCEDGRVELIMTATDDCTNASDLRWEINIDLYQDGTLDTLASGVGDRADATGDYPIGSHWVYFSFEDQCGNKTTCRKPFTVVNCKAPTAYCKNGLVVDLMPQDTNSDGTIDWGVIDIWANDLDDSSLHPCGNEITFSFSRDTSDKFRRYTCDSLGMRSVTIFVTDKVTGEISSCQTFVEVQDNQGACSMTSGILSGRLETAKQTGIYEVEMQIDGSVNTKDMFNSAYRYDNMPLNGDYMITPKKDDHHMNGISTKDLVILQRYLLGMLELDHPYQFIAADANNDQDLSIADVASIRKLILGRTSRFEKNNSWRFIDADYQFQDPKDPLQETWPESYDITNLNVSVMSVDFVGIKIGDLDESVDPAGINGNSTRSEQSFPVTLSKTDNIIQIVAQSDIITSGLQMSIDIGSDFIELMDVDAGRFHLDERNVSLTNSSLRIAWAADQDVDVRKGEVLFTLYFDGAETWNPVMVDYPLLSEIYDATLEGFALQAERTKEVEDITVHQNQPNPFDQNTQIGIESPGYLDAEFKVYDASGRTFIQKSVELNPGVNVIEVDHNQLSGTGVYYYQVSTHYGTITKKMVLVE